MAYNTTKLYLTFTLMTCALVLFLALPRCGTAAESAATKPTVEDLVTRLGSDDPGERSKAANLLVARGPGVRGQLEKAATDPGADLNLKMQIKRVLRKLGESRILNRYDAPKRISLNEKGIVVKQALEKLRKAFGWTVTASEEIASRKIDVAVKEVRFFEALEAIRRAAKAFYKPAKHDQKLDDHTLPFLLESTKPGGAAIAYSAGPFLVYFHGVTNHANLNASLLAGTVTERRQTSLQGHLVTEPGLPHPGVTIGDVTMAYKDGQALPPHSLNLSNWMDPTGPEGAKNYSLNASLQSKPAEKKSLGADFKLTVNVPLEVKCKHIKDLATVFEKPIVMGGDTFTFHKPVKDGKNWTIMYDWVSAQNLERGGMAGGAVASASATAMGGGHARRKERTKGAPKYQAGMFFLDQDGYLLNTGGYGSSTSNNRCQISLTLDGKPHALVINSIRETVARSYKVAFKAIPLP